VFSLAGWSPRIQSGFHVSGSTQVPETGSRSSFAYGTLTLYGRPFQDRSATRAICNSPAALRDDHAGPTTPVTQRPQAFTQQVWATPLSLATTQGIENFFLFLRVLRCVISPGSLRTPYVFRCGYQGGSSPFWVSPFGDPCFIARLRLYTAYRSLPRPSSASSAKASTIRSYYLDGSRIRTMRFSKIKRLALAGAPRQKGQSPVKALKTE
jgi:hypothetical protein